MRKICTHIYILAALLALAAAGCGLLAGALLAQTLNTIHTENFIEFETALPTQLLDINGEVITEFASDEKREIIAFDDLPQHMVDALITREDRIFYEHPGFSAKAIFRAILGQLTGNSLGGGSTLTQQIAGTLYCDRTEKSIVRKIEELWWALQMERRYSKNEILEQYLNRIYFGGGTYGVNAASKYYFGHGADQITPAEAAILVIQLSNPAYYNPFDYPNRAMERQRDVLTAMADNGLITKEAADASFDEYWLNFDYTRISSSAYFMRDDKAPWFSEYVRRELSDMMYGAQDIYTGGFTVNTTVDLKKQQAAQTVMEKYISYANRAYQRSSGARRNDAVSTYIPMTELIALVFNLPQIKVSEQMAESRALSQYRSEINPILDVMTLMTGIDPLKIQIVNRVNSEVQQASGRTTIEGALISLENDTGYIAALIGGSEYSADNQFIRAIQAQLQPGSTFKPLYYSAAIDSRKFTAATPIYDTPVVFHTEDGKPYIPLNFRGEWLGSVQLWYALAKSMNVPSLKVLDGIGFDAAIERSTALLGIPQEEWEQRGFRRVYPLGLGVVTVSPMQMARAYAVFANQGKAVTPIAIRSVEDRNGRILLNPELDIRMEQQNNPEVYQIISPQNAYIMTDILKNSVRMGTLAWGSSNGTKFRYKDENGRYYTIPAAGKTGTTQNWADAWAVGYTPYLTTAVWFGFDNRVGQSLGLDLTGATLAGVAWGDYMSIANEDYPYRDFTQPQTGLVRAQVCSVSGQILTEACGDSRTTQYFLSGTEPTVVCEYHSNISRAKNISIDRLQKERNWSGVRPFAVTDAEQLKLDLSFLNEPQQQAQQPAQNNTAARRQQTQQSQTRRQSQTQLTPQQQEQPRVPPTHNYLLD